MNPLRHHLFASIAAILMVGTISGVAPLAAIVIGGPGAVDDCCPDDESGAADEELPCSPFCHDCACGFGGRFVPQTEMRTSVDVPPPAQVFVVVALAGAHLGPTASFVDEILRPPRV